MDDFQGSILRKIEEVYEVSRNEGCEFVVCGGDIFNSHRIFSYELLGSAMDLICDSGLDTYTVVGQHDLIGYNRETFKSSTLAFVVDRCPSLRVIWEPTTVGCVRLAASHVWEDPKDVGSHEMDRDFVNVLVAHHLLTDKDTVFDIVNTSDFVGWMKDEERYDIVLSGDLHCGYSVHEVDGVWFCNPGSLTRQSTNDRMRSPKFAIIDVEAGGIPIIDERELECAQKGDVVFGESAAEIMRSDLKLNPSVFIREVEEFEAESVDIQELIQKVGKVRGIRQEVLNYLASV